MDRARRHRIPLQNEVLEVPWTKGRRSGTAARAEDKGHSENAGQHPHEATSVSRGVELEDRHDKRRVGGDVEGQTDVHGPTGTGLRHEKYNAGTCGWRQQEDAGLEHAEPKGAEERRTRSTW
jgi:hypothetical protein